MPPLPYTVEDLKQGIEELNIKLHRKQDILYKYVDVATAITILESDNIRYAIPSTFFDKTDMSLDLYDFSATTDEAKQHAQQFLFKNIPENKRQLMIKALTKTHFEYALRELAIKQRNTTSVFCASANYRIPKMWETYGKSGTGICLGLHLPQSPNENIIMFTGHVNYAQQMIPRKMLPITDLNIILSVMYWAYTKSYRYTVEEEIRSVLYSSGKDIDMVEDKYRYANLLLSEIYFGENCSKSDIDNITAMIARKKYPINKHGIMYYPQRSFEMDVNYL